MRKIILAFVLLMALVYGSARAENTVCLTSERWDDVLKQCVSTLPTSNSAVGRTNDGRNPPADVVLKDDAMDPLSSDSQTNKSQTNTGQTNPGSSGLSTPSAGGVSTVY